MRPRLVVAGLLVGLLGCSDSASLEVPESEYYPLRVGLTWTYRGNGGGCVIRVARHEAHGGHACAVVETRIDNRVVTTERVFSEKDGVYVLSRNGMDLSPPMPLLKLPPRPGRSWRFDFRSGGTTQRGVYVLSEEEVEVPAGTYKAVTLRGEILQRGVRQMALNYWFVRGVGMVKQVVELPEATRVYELEKVEEKAR
jgi:hypothetical protein